MAPKPTKTPILTHAAQNASHVQQNYPPPRNPNVEQKTQPLGQSASQPNLNDPNKEIQVCDDMPENLPVYYRSKSCFRWLVLFLSCWAMFGSYYWYVIILFYFSNNI